MKCGHKLWARSTSSVSIEMTGRQEGPVHTGPALTQDGSFSQRSWHLMIMCLRRSLLVTREQNICLFKLWEEACIIFCLMELCALPSVRNGTLTTSVECLQVETIESEGHFPTFVLDNGSQRCEILYPRTKTTRASGLLKAEQSKAGFFSCSSSGELSD